MTVLVVGASGATGKHLVEQLLKRDETVRVIVRTPENLPESWKKNSKLLIIREEISAIGIDSMAEYLMDCDAVASCLGHNLTWKGIYGAPRKLVTDAVKLICHSIKKNASDKPVKLLLMNTAGNRNRDLNERISTGQRFAIAVLRILLPPHSDNEQAADYLRTEIGQDDKFIEWVAVRPDNLINEDDVTEYEIYPSPTRSALFNAGVTSRINVGHFMAELIRKNDLWKKWKGQMPVIYNKADDN